MATDHATIPLERPAPDAAPRCAQDAAVPETGAVPGAGTLPGAMRRENFHVLSRFVPPALREDFANVYAFCRRADDIADEHPHTDASRVAALSELARWRALLDEAHAFARSERSAPPDHPVFGPLAHTMRRRALDAAPFHDLLSAFEQDQRVSRYETWDDLLDYCARSANPVGRIVLALIHSPPARGKREGEGDSHANVTSAALHILSDAVCTALQLTNFWQDVRRDLLDRGRVYLPLAETGLDAATLRAWAATPDDPEARVVFIRALRPLVRRTRELFADAHALPALIDDPDLSRVVRLFLRGGERTLDAIEAIGCATLWRRPALTARDKAMLVLRERLRRPRNPRAGAPGLSPFVAHSLRRCADATRREARNFYFGLRLTPEPRRSALYAVYAWMRDADDDADNDDRVLPTRPQALARVARRRARLAALVERAELDTAHHAWAGLAWSLREYPIDPADLFALLDGLEDDANHRGVDTRDDLRVYCERVAGAPGRVCVALWGLRPGADAHAAREMATSRGVAFQLTNILRDVARDYAAGRVYLPRADLARFGVSARDVAEWTRPAEAGALVRDLCAWARREFAVSEGLDSMVDPACAPAMRAMTETYAGLLSRIERDPSVVACEPRASLPLREKLGIALRAWASSRAGALRR